MSDFGAILILGKTNGNFVDADKPTIIEAVSEIIEQGDYSEVIKEGGYKTIYDWREGSLCIKLSEYYDDEDADEVREFAEEEDMDEAADIAARLKHKLGSEYIITPAFEDW